jgi:Protein of unknown function (DUF998)
VVRQLGVGEPAIHSCRSSSTAAAYLAVAATVLAAVGLVLATRGGPGFAGYVSESGVAGAPHAVLYRATLFLVALAAAAAALALRPVAVLAAAALGLAVPCLLVSAAVQCSAGCPLPPYQQPTAGDLVHAGASIAAVGLCGLAMLAAALRSVDRRVRDLSRWMLWLMIPTGTAMAGALLLAGHTVLTGVLERVCLAGCLFWVAAAAALRTRPGSRDTHR